ncbi:MAG TPA: Ig-like domain-containing protein [Capsulimonadaceae bacterium]|nr:Ig-like domain-containing protein [Capsulimonadaceae bacterium]
MSTSLASSLNPSTVGDSVTFTATISPVAPGSGSVDDGTVAFTDGTTTLGTVDVSGGMAAFTTSALAAGTHKIKAAYSGGTNGKASASSALTQTVNKSTPNVSVTSSANPARWSQPITFTARVSPASGSIVPTGKVMFMNGIKTLGTVALSDGTASITVTLPVGSYSITAIYEGDADYVSNTSSALNQSVIATDTTTGLDSSPNPSTVGQQVALTATVTAEAPGMGTINSGTVTFREGSKTWGSAPVHNGKAVLLIDTFTKGNHDITAIFHGTSFANPSVSGTLVQSVN